MTQEQATTPGGWSWFRVPIAALDAVPEIGRAAFVVFCAMAKHADADGKCWPGITTLQKLSGCCRQTVVDAIDALERIGFVQVQRSERTPDAKTLDNNRYLIPSLTTRLPQSNQQTTLVQSVDQGWSNQQTGTIPSKQKPRNKKASIDSIPIPSEIDTPAFREAWATFSTHRSELTKPLTPTAAGMALKRLAEMGEPRAIAAIEHTIEKGWQGIREPDVPGLFQQRNATPKPSKEIPYTRYE